MAGDDDDDYTTQPADEKRAKVTEWLLKAGYPLEMRVARAFAGSPFTRVVQGDVYRVKEGEDKFREIDVAAQLGMHLHRPEARGGKGASMFVDLFTVCECKSNAKRNRPWVVFTDRTEQEPFYRIVAHQGSSLGERLLEHLSRDIRTGDLDLFTTPRIGYAAHCATLGPNPATARTIKTRPMKRSRPCSARRARKRRCTPAGIKSSASWFH